MQGAVRIWTNAEFHRTRWKPLQSISTRLSWFKTAVCPKCRDGESGQALANPAKLKTRGCNPYLRGDFPLLNVACRPPRNRRATLFGAIKYDFEFKSSSSLPRNAHRAPIFWSNLNAVDGSPVTGSVQPAISRIPQKRTDLGVDQETPDDDPAKLLAAIHDKTKGIADSLFSQPRPARAGTRCWKD